MADWSLTLGGVKTELVLSPPILAASGTMAYGRESGAMLRSGVYGAWVTPPLTWRACPGSRPPRLAETVAGYLLHTGRRNPGLRRVARHHGRFWARLGLPVILALYGREVDELERMADEVAAQREMGGLEAVGGIELHLPHDVLPDCAADLTAAVVELAGVPCLVRVPFERSVEIALAAGEGGADAVVVAAPPLARAPADDGSWLYGPLHSPALAPLYLELVHGVASAVEMHVIARGGIVSADDIIHALACGAVAVQLDSILLVDPDAGDRVLSDLSTHPPTRDASTWDEVLTACHAVSP